MFLANVNSSEMLITFGGMAVHLFDYGNSFLQQLSWCIYKTSSLQPALIDDIKNVAEFTVVGLTSWCWKHFTKNNKKVEALLLTYSFVVRHVVIQNNIYLVAFLCTRSKLAVSL